MKHLSREVYPLNAQNLNDLYILLVYHIGRYSISGNIVCELYLIRHEDVTDLKITKVIDTQIYFN